MPHLVQMQDDWGGEEFTIVGVTDASAAETEAFAADHALNFPVLAGTDLNRKNYGVELVWGCVYFLVDRGGTILADDLAQAEELLEEELGPR